MQKLLATTALLLGACAGPPSEDPQPEEHSSEPTGELHLPELVSRDWGDIAQDGVLSVALPTDSTSYFLYRGEPMGVEYDLLEAFADEHSLKLQIHRIQGREARLAALAVGGVDIAGGRLTSATASHPSLAFSTPIAQVQPTAIQANPDVPLMPEDLDGMPEFSVQTLELDVRPLTEPEDLAGQEVWVQRDSEWIPTLLEVEDEYGDITVVGVNPEISTETLIRWVATGRIRLTVASDQLAELKSNYYQNIETEPVLGPPTDYGFVMRASSPGLAEELDQWIAENSETITETHRRYFEARAGYRERIADNPLSGPVSTLSDYDELFRALAPQLGWDWRLLASQAFQESRFDPNATSWAGARGLLQIMPATAAELGVQDLSDPTENAQGAVSYLAWLDEQWQPTITDEGERLKFVLASYNAGMGHVQDAQRLTETYGGNPNHWDDVAVWMLQLSRSEYYSDPVVEYGFCRGAEPVMYVDRILDRYEHYYALVEG